MIKFKVTADGDLIKVITDSLEPVITIPQSVDGIIVNKIDIGAFNGNTNIRCVYIPKTVKALSFQAFKGCFNLETVVFEEGSQLEWIGEGCFYNCIKLTNINMEVLKNLKKILAQVFYNCKSLSFVDLSNTHTEIYSETFFDSGLEKIILPKSLKHIYTSAFDSSKVDINFDDIPNLKTIEACAFRGTKIKAVDFSNNTALRLIVKEKAFYGCENLKTVITSKTTALAGPSIFEDCKNLQNLEIHTFASCIPEKAFKGCKNLSSVDMAKSGIKKIEFGAFQNCSSLMSIDMPSTINHIYEYAFDSCNLSENVDLTKVENDLVLGNNCFANSCISIKSIKLDFFKPITIEGNPFDNSACPLKLFQLSYPFTIKKM